MIPNTSVPAVSASESVRETKLTALRRFQLSMQAYQTYAYVKSVEGWSIRAAQLIWEDYARLAQLKRGRNLVTGRRLRTHA